MICASYKESGEVKACFPHSVMFPWGEKHIGKKFKAPCDKKTAEFIVRECQCDQPNVEKLGSLIYL